MSPLGGLHEAFGGLPIIESAAVPVGQAFVINGDGGKVLAVWRGHKPSRLHRMAWRLRHPFTETPLVGRFRDVVASFPSTEDREHGL